MRKDAFKIVKVILQPIMDVQVEVPENTWVMLSATLILEKGKLKVWMIIHKETKDCC